MTKYISIFPKTLTDLITGTSVDGTFLTPMTIGDYIGTSADKGLIYGSDCYPQILLTVDTSVSSFDVYLTDSSGLNPYTGPMYDWIGHVPSTKPPGL